MHATIARLVPLDALDPARVMGSRSRPTEAPLYVICRSGNCGKMGCEKLRAAGHANVVNVEGGTQAREQAGLSVVRGKKTISPGRQVLLGALLGAFVPPYFLGLSGFTGAGRVFAGVTDTCGMGKLWVRMPWSRVEVEPGSCPRGVRAQDWRVVQRCPPYKRGAGTARVGMCSAPRGGSAWGLRKRPGLGGPAMFCARPGRLVTRLTIAAGLAMGLGGSTPLRAAEGVAPLPEGVRAVWSLESAFREATPTRERISINGLWRWQPAAPDAERPPGEGWGHFKVPAPWPGITDYMQHDAQTLFPHPGWKDVKLGALTRAWYQREVTIPAEWAGRRLALEVGVLNSLATVLVDGRNAGELRFPGGELDLSGLKLEPGPHELTLLVVAVPLKGVLLSYIDTANARQVNGTVARRGLCGDVFLAATPAVARIDDVRVETSVREKRLAIETALSGLEAGRSYTLRATILREGREVARHDSPHLSAADLAEGRFRFAAEHQPDRLWDLHTPANVETLRLTLLDDQGQALDTFWDQRFGFREFRIDGRDFFLNGSRIHLSSVPLDNAQVSVATASYAAARESLERLKGFGINYVYTHNYGCEPGSHLAFEEILRAADDVGMLVGLSQPHFSHYDWKAPDADRENGYRRHAAAYVRMAGNHPSVVFYPMSHNATGYGEDMNPYLYGGVEAPRDRWALGNVKLAQRAEAIVRGLDPSRIVYHHASGNLGVMHDTNFYPNFVPIQELSDWFETWSKEGVKPAFTCEYGAPFTWDWTMYRGWYKGERSFGSARVPWEFCLAEWNAQFFGDRAYDITEMEERNLRWEARQFREGKLWNRWDYPFQVGSEVFDLRHEIIGRYLTDNFRSFRTWGLSASSPWEHGHFWRLREGVDRSRKPLPVDWGRLQRPGYSADFDGPTYERMDLAHGRDDWEPTADAQALLRNNRPRLGYIGGKPERFTSKDHNARPGTTVAKQLIVVNEARVPTTCEITWTLDLPAPLEGSTRVEVPTGDQRRIPVELALPADLGPGRYTMQARFRFDNGEVQEDRLDLDVLPNIATGPIVARGRIALFDPKGETAALLKSLGVGFEPVAADADLDGFDLLIVGKAALDLEGPAPRLDRVCDGLDVIVFEQTSAALEKRLGFRVVEYGLREVYPRVPDHPVLAGLGAGHLRDWCGAATLLPPRLDYEMRPGYGPTVKWCDIPVTRVWRCGNNGSVASVLIEKPARGNFLPLVDGGYSLQYSPLLEYREGRGRVVFCQLDVTGRTEADPAADTIVRNLLGYVTAAPPPPGFGRTVAYVGEPAGLAHLKAAGIDVTELGEGRLETDQVLVVGPGADALLAPRAQAIAAWLGAGGHLVAVGCGEADLGAVLAGLRTREAEHIAAVFEPPGASTPLAGVGPADVHNRDPREINLVAGGAEALGDGVLAVGAEGRAVLCQLVPWAFNQYEGKPNVKRTFRKTAFLLSRVLGNLGVSGATPLLERIATPVATATEPRWKDGFYLDPPEEWDDPYRFFRW